VAKRRQEADVAQNPDETEIQTEAGAPTEGDETQGDERSGAQQPGGGVDPVIASPQQYPGKPGT
jgi:hypothetical protein